MATYVLHANRFSIRTPYVQYIKLYGSSLTDSKTLPQTT